MTIIIYKIYFKADLRQIRQILPENQVFSYIDNPICIKTFFRAKSALFALNLP